MDKTITKNIKKFGSGIKYNPTKNGKFTVELIPTNPQRITLFTAIEPEELEDMKSQIKDDLNLNLRMKGYVPIKDSWKNVDYYDPKWDSTKYLWVVRAIYFGKRKALEMEELNIPRTSGVIKYGKS